MTVYVHVIIQLKITSLGWWKHVLAVWITLTFYFYIPLDMLLGALIIPRHVLWWMDYPWICYMKDRLWMCSMRDGLSLAVFTRAVIQTHGLSLFRDLLLHQFTWIKIVYILWIKILLLLIPLENFKVIIFCVVVHWTGIGTPDSYRKTPFSCILL